MSPMTDAARIRELEAEVRDLRMRACRLSRLLPTKYIRCAARGYKSCLKNARAVKLNENCGECIKYDAKRKRCKRDGSPKMKVNGCMIGFVPKGNNGNPADD